MVIEEVNLMVIKESRLLLYSVSFGMATFRSVDHHNDRILWELMVPISKALDVDKVISLLGNNVIAYIKSGILEKIEKK